MDDVQSEGVDLRVARGRVPASAGGRGWGCFFWSLGLDRAEAGGTSRKEVGMGTGFLSGF